MNTFRLTIYLLVLIQFITHAQGLSIGTGTTFSLGSSTLTIPGNWSNSGTFSAGSGTVVFNGTSGNQTITNSSGETFYNLIVNKSVGDLQLNNDISINGTLTLTSGDLDINTHTITFASDAGLSESSGNTCKNGLLTVSLGINAPSSNNICGFGIELTSSSDFGTTTITRGHTAQNGSGNSGIQRYYDIAPANNSGLNADLVFHYDDSELNSLDESTLQLFKSDDGGTNWTLIGGTVNTTNNTVTASGINTFSRWTLASNSAPLPVELLSFYAVTEKDGVTIKWTTATEVDNYGFDVERKSGIGKWEKMIFIAGHGNSSSPKEYTYTDYKITNGMYAYRLKQIDSDGSFTYSDIMEINYHSQPSSFELRQNYPNPFNVTTVISYQLPVISYIQLKIYDLLGNEIATLVDEQKEPGVYEVEWDASNFSTGLYFYRLQSGSFNSVMKLVLLK